MEGVYFIPFPKPFQTHPEKMQNVGPTMLKRLASTQISAQSISSVVLDLQPCIQIQYQQFKIGSSSVVKKARPPPRLLLHNNNINF